MGKAKNVAGKVRGQAKEKVGELTGDDDLKREGKTEQVVSDVRQAAEKVEDAIKEL